MIAPLTVVDQRAKVAQVGAVLLNGSGHKLAGLGGREGGAFF